MNRDYFADQDWSAWAPHHHVRARQWFAGQYARRGDIGPLVLQVLKEKPMHGYEIMRQLEDKSHGLWRPSPGSIYPTLQMLEEQELVKSREVDGKKVYQLTKKGLAEAAKTDTAPPWESHKFDVERFMRLRAPLFEMMRLLKVTVRQGSDETVEQVETILATARDQLAELVKDQSKKSKEESK